MGSKSDMIVSGYSVRHECTRIYKKQIAPLGKMYYIVYVKDVRKTYHAWALCNSSLNDDQKVWVYNELLEKVRTAYKLI